MAQQRGRGGWEALGSVDQIALVTITLWNVEFIYSNCKEIRVSALNTLSFRTTEDIRKLI